MAMMNAAVVTSFAEPPHYQRFEVPRPRTADEIARRRPRRRPAPARPERRRRRALHQHRHAADDPRHRRRRARPDGRRVYFVADDDVHRHDGGQGAGRPAPLDRAARRRRCRQGRRRDEPGDVGVGRASPPRSDRAGPERARPRRDRQRRERWPSRWPSGSAPGAWSAPGATPAGFRRSRQSAPTTSSS